VTEELSPPGWIVESVEEGQRLRGWIANSYAQIEFILGDIIVQSLRLAEYNEVGTALPHGAPDRIKRVRRILEFEGVFSEFRDELAKILADFEDHHEVRNLLAHGLCTVYHTSDNDFGLEFRKWHRVPDRQDAQLIKTFRLVDLEYHKSSLVELSQRALELHYRIHDRLGLIEP
jgi:hypothetical protein